MGFDKGKENKLGDKKTTDKDKAREERMRDLDESLNRSSEDKISIVNKHLGKPGLDIEEGKYRVAGTVSESPVFIRKKAKTNIAVSCGYNVEEIETGKRLMMTKREAVYLAAKYGMRNAFIRIRTHEKKDKEGNVIKQDKTIYLQPYPAVKESFTQDDRLVNVFKMTPDNKIEYPVELAIKEEDCTKDFWIRVQQMYKKRKKSRSRRRYGKGGKEEKHRKRIIELEAKISETEIRNPFKS